MMTTISDRDRAEAQAMAEVFYGCGVVRVPSDGGVRRWLTVRDHVLAAHECPTVPVWRPTTADEIQAGWEVRFPYGLDGAVYTIAHHRYDGEWFSENDEWNFSDMGGLETTAPAPEPEPWPDELVEALADTMGTTLGGTTWEDDARAVLNLLASRGLIERPKAGA